MKPIVGAVVLSALLASCVWPQSPGALQTDPGGWVDLLSNKTLSDWTRIAIPPGAPLKDLSPWTLDPSTGNMVCDGDKAGHEMLRYNREFINFVLHVEFRFTKLEVDAKYNSGVFVRNSADGSVWHQAQVGSASGGYLFGNTLVNGAPQRVNLRDQVKENRVKAAGEWNTFEVRAEGSKISLWVNGAVTSEFVQCEVLRGYVALEAEGYKIEFRNVKLKQLP